jgi:outer membrane protein OmpA-like peptidoglycan-associated protein
MPGQRFPTGPAMASAMPAPYSGPVVVDSRGVTTLGPGGPVTSPGPYGSPYGPSVATTGYTPGMMPGTAAAATGVMPGTLPLSTYGPMMGARSQRVAVIYFADGSSGLSGRDRAVLAQVANLQRQYRGVLRVVGHASSRTNATSITRHKLANFNVSLARANAVASALMNNGVPGRFLYVGAVSDAQPVYYEVMPTGEAGNRRAEIYLDY